MNFLMKLRREIGRLLRERATWLFIAFTVAGAVWFCLNSNGTTATDAYVLTTAKNSAVLGALLFTLLTLIQFHRDYKNNTDTIILTCTDPLGHQLRRTLALLCAAVVTTLLVSLFALPYALIQTGSYFQLSAFAAAWYLVFFGALVLSILLASGLYMLLRRVEAAFIAMMGLITLSVLLESMYALNPSYQLFWVQTNAAAFSDLVNNQILIDLIVYNRLFCVPAAAAVWLLGLCCQRRYGRGIAGSFRGNARRIWPPALLAAVIICAALSYACEPLFDNSVAMDYGIDYESGTGMIMIVSSDEEEEDMAVTLTGKTVDLSVDTQRRTAAGTAVYTLQNTSGEPQDLTLTMNSGYTIQSASVNGRAVQATRDREEVSGSATWHIALPADETIRLSLSYGGRIQNDGSLSQTPVYGISDGYLWLPPDGVSPNAEVPVAEDCDFSARLTLDESLIPDFADANTQTVDTGDGKTTWVIKGTGYAGTGVIAAEYRTKTFQAGGLTVQLKYFAKQTAEIESMDAVNVIQAALDYFTDTYGALPYDNALTILELPASFSGGFAAGNTSAMDETCFAAAGYLPGEGSTPDEGSGIDTIVHELAHQWWGLATYPLSDDASWWSAEGITCYSTYCFMKEYFGEAYANAHFTDVWQDGWETYQNAFYVQHPEYLSKLSDDDASRVMAALHSIGLYDIMPLQLLEAEEAAGGQETFQSKLADLYQYNLCYYITYEDFLFMTELTEEALNIA